ncbi:MAG: vWA domain-containing protein [Methanothrix sp.]
MILDLYFATPELLWAIPFILLLGAFIIRTRAKNRLFAVSRLLAFCLIIAAAANPYFVEVHTVSSQKPSITILDDRTGSMGIFDPDVAARVKSFVDAPLRTFSGDATPLGDRIVQYALPGSTLLLVTDGYSNSGRPLADALALARASNTTTFALSLAPQRDDAGVEISGTNTAVLAGDYPFKVLVRSSKSYQGPLSVFADDKLIYSDTIVANTSASIKISHSFLETGNHILRATIAPDRQPINDNYQKAVYVVPKPQVLLISSGNSPLATNLNDLYKLTLVSELPDQLKGYKAIVLDDIRYNSNLDQLQGYVREGGGLVVVGGEDAYDLGDYQSSSLEEFLPVRSTPSIFEGGKTLIFVLDISFSLLSTRAGDGTPLLDYEKALAVELLKSPHFQDYKVGLIVFGTKAYDVQDPVPLSRAESVLRERIMSLAPTGTENSYLDSGLELAWDMLNVSGGQGELVILSDGNLYNYPEVVQRSIDLLSQMNVTARLVQVQAFPGATGRFDYLAAQTGSDYSAFVYPDSLTTTMQEAPPDIPAEESSPSGYAVNVVNKNHYITADLNLNATVTGFNDVTPRSGAQRLAALPDGKPVLTVWRYGLGRVAALTVDDGSAWAGSLYASPSSQMISSTVNWAVGDPRPQDDRVEADDGWQGTPLSVTISSNARPSLPDADVEKVSDNRYVATFMPNSSGIYYIGSYGLAVNYPLEYRDIGFNPELSRLIMANGGKVFSEDEARQSLVVEAGRVSQRTVQERLSRRDILLLLALLIFLAEILYRKLDEMRRRGRFRA